MKIQEGNQRNKKVSELLRKLTAEFLEKESNRQSLITVTRAIVSSDLKKAVVYITVLPEDKEEAALLFAKRKRKELREFVKSKTKFRVLPFLEMEIDKGQKLEQKISELKIQ